MESYEPTSTVFSRIQNIDPKNAWRIMGYILLHYTEHDMMRFACAPETLIISIVNKAKTDLGLLSSTLSASNITPISNPITISKTNPFSHSISSPRLPNNGSSNPTNGYFFSDDFHLQDQNFSSFNVDLGVSPGCMSDSVLYPYGENNAHVHRRCSSFNDVYFGSSDDLSYEFGSKICPYYLKGFCKNGSACKLVHSGEFLDSGDNSCPIVGSPCNKYDGFKLCEEDILRSNLAHQQRLSAQFMSKRANLPYNKLNFLQYDTPRSAALAMMMEEELHKLNRVRMSRNDFSGMNMRGDSSPASKQIYLTFPADSTFKEEDVTEYFGRFGPVQDVRIPYQQKRMFGFVTFVYPQTVNLILAKGNPHFVCDSRVLVKPYKEKGKLPDKKQHQQQQQLEKAEFLCSSPSALDSRDPFDFQLGGRMSYSTQEMLLKKHLEEQADLQQALELQGRRMINLQLLDLNNHQHHQHNLAVGSPVLSPIVSQASLNHNVLSPSDGTSNVVLEENKESSIQASNLQLANGNNSDVRKEDKLDHEESELPKSLEHVLPDNLFASPTKVDSENKPSVFYPALEEFDDGAAKMGSSSAATNSSSMAATSSLDMAPHKSCLFEMPRLSSEHETLGIKHDEQRAD